MSIKHLFDLKTKTVSLSCSVEKIIVGEEFGTVKLGACKNGARYISKERTGA